MLERQIELGMVHCSFGGGGGGGGSQITETEDMKAQAEINQKLWDFYTESYKPEIEKYAAMKTDPAVAEQEKKQVAGQINAEIMKQVPAGGDINPVKNVRELTRIGETGTAADIQGQGAVRSRTISGMQNVIDIGRGQATTADVGLRELSEESVRSAISQAGSERFEKEAESEAAASILGAGTAFVANRLLYKR